MCIRDRRWNSTAGPVAKIALMLLPVATLLAHVASDKRHEKDQRDRATALLKTMDAKFCTATGVSADWGIICKWFLRLFDVASHDIAKSRSQVDCMLETLDAVFVHGRVFQHHLGAHSRAALAGRDFAADEPLPPDHKAVSDAGLEVGFITSQVMRNLSRKYVFYAEGMPVLLWGEPPEAHKAELLDRLQNVASLTKERLRADFPRTDVRSALAMFDRRLLQKGFGPQADDDMRKFLLAGAKKLAALLDKEEAATLLQYNGVLPYMMQQMAPGQPLAAKTNQQAWALLLDDDVWAAACPGRFGAGARALRRVIRFYISIEDGECTVERDLAEFRSQMLQHRADDLNFHDDCLMLKLNGPTSAEDFDEGTDASGVELTPISREYASLWRKLMPTRRGHFNAAAIAAAKRARNCLLYTSPSPRDRG